MKFQFALLLNLITLTAAAQYPSNGGRFQASEIRGCAPFTVNITNLVSGYCTGIPGDPACDPTWGDGTLGPQNSFTHTYTQPGNYRISILYGSIGSDFIDIVVTANIAPAFDLFTCDGGQVQVRVTDLNYDTYIIDYNDPSADVQVPKGPSAVDIHTYTLGPHLVSVRGKNLNAADNCASTNQNVSAINAQTPSFINQLTVASASQVDLNFSNTPNSLYRLEIATNTIAIPSFQLLQTLHDLNTISASNASINTDNNYYCFRLGATNPCTGSPPVYSNIICSANFDLTPQNNVNNLAWSTSTSGVTNFTVNRDGASIASPVGLAYADNTVVCNTDYCYQLLTNYANGSQSISLQKCGRAFSTDVPTTISDVTAVVGSGSVELIWQQDPAFTPAQYNIYRRAGTGNYELIDNTTGLQYTDNNYATSQEYCYQIDYDDICDNRSNPSTDVCPIRLRAKVENDNSIELIWSDYSGWSGGVTSYTVEKYDEQGTPLNTFPAGTATNYTDASIDPSTQVYVYVVKADGAPGLGQAVSNETKVTKEPHLNYPKAFTPNGDNLNDTFTVFGEYVVEFEMKIFNRWGELLFSTDNLEEGWDGKFKGTLQPEGTYTFIASLTDLSGRRFKRSGTVVLLRKK